MPSLIERITGRREKDSDAPVCPDHDVELLYRGKLGRPTRFAKQSVSEYKLIYFCPTKGCSYTEERDVRRNQASIPGAQPERPVFSRRND